MKKNHIRRVSRVFIALISLMVMLCFQNCGIVIPDKEEGVQKSSGNGDPYTGIEAKSGTYYYVVDDSYQCPGGLDLERENIAKTLTITQGSDVVELKDLCTGDVISLPRSALRLSFFNPRYLGIARLTFQRLSEEQLERGLLRRAISKCFDKTRLGREIFIFQSIVNRNFIAQIYEAGVRASREIDLTQDKADLEEVVFSSQDGEFQLQINRQLVNSDTTLASNVYDVRSLNHSVQVPTSAQPTPNSDAMVSCYLDP